MSRRYKAGVDREQGMLLPERVEDYVSVDNPVRALDAYVDSLDLQALGFTHTSAGVSPGQPAYPPAALLKLYLYGYLQRVRSSRRLEQECYRNLEVIWLVEGLKPNNKTIANFRKDNVAALRAANRDFVLLCRELDLYGRELVAIDGSFLRGNAGGKGIHTRSQLKRRLQRIEADIARHLAALDAADADEDREAESGQPLAEKLATLRERQAREQARLATLETSGESQLSEVDPDARRLQKNGQRVCGYNVQLAVDSRHKLLVSCEVTNEGNDSGQLAPMAQRAQAALGAESLEVVADTGYFHGEQLRACEASGITAYVPESAPRGSSAAAGRLPRSAFVYDADSDRYRCPRGEWLRRTRTYERQGQRRFGYTSAAAVCAHCPLRAACLPRRNRFREIIRGEHEGWLETVYRPRMAEATATARLRQRAALAEHPFATLKRWCGWDHFLMRGLSRVQGEMDLLMLSYNLRRVLQLLGPQGLREVLAARARRARELASALAGSLLTGFVSGLLRRVLLGFSSPRTTLTTA